VELQQVEAVEDGGEGFAGGGEFVGHRADTDSK
jgi:hypothetical protein